MTWNLLHGGGSRLASIVRLIRHEQPDILAVQELGGSRSRSRFRRDEFEARTGLTGHVAPSLFGQAVGVFWRPELTAVRRSSMRWQLHHAAAAVTLGGGLTVVSAHLNPYAPERRRREAVWLTARFAHRGPTVLAGDLNSLSVPGPLPPAYRKRHLDPDGTIDTRAMAAFARGFTDAWREAGEGDGNTVPTALRGAEFAPMRLDYVLLAGGVHATSARVARDAPDASDHYPVVVTLETVQPPGTSTIRS
jgi:exodeoxyribonuclease III